MFRAAFRSRSSSNPQFGHLCTLTQRGFSTASPHLEHLLVVPLASTFDPPTSSFGLVDEHVKECGPSGVRAVLAVVSHLDKFSHIQILNRYEIVAVDIAARELVEKVKTLVSNPLVYACQHYAMFLTILGALPFPRKPALFPL